VFDRNIFLMPLALRSAARSNGPLITGLVSGHAAPYGAVVKGIEVAEM
jgi:hypothetical protein